MTTLERNRKIELFIAARTRQGLKSRAAARKMLIEEGIYTEKGNLKKEFGGRGAPVESSQLLAATGEN